ncbi:hypothetical protein SeLEV6574_g06609 [Synchytrium endobioticum]|uniref:Uncharacterized protein n=1 Tax=Synchytrium endobioticum TaxID=286115 RepID=A0A507CKX8_9FUNG|nr:hypothetical protein SeLEV6574_g06609 [Synchytrium endobioticum]
MNRKEFLLKEHWTPNPWTKDQDHAHEMSSTANVKGGEAQLRRERPSVHPLVVVVGHQVDDDNSDGPETSKKSFSDGTRAISVAISISDYLKRFKSKTTAMKRKADDSANPNTSVTVATPAAASIIAESNVIITPSPPPIIAPEGGKAIPTSANQRTSGVGNIQSSASAAFPIASELGDPPRRVA